MSASRLRPRVDERYGQVVEMADVAGDERQPAGHRDGAYHRIRDFSVNSPGQSPGMHPAGLLCRHTVKWNNVASVPTQTLGSLI